MAWGEAKYKFDFYDYNYSLTVLKCKQFPTKNIALSFT